MKFADWPISATISNVSRANMAFYNSMMYDKDSPKLNKYVVAFISFHDNVLTQEIIEAESELGAAKIKLSDEHGGAQMYCQSLKELKSQCFDMDSMISVFQI